MNSEDRYGACALLGCNVGIKNAYVMALDGRSGGLYRYDTEMAFQTGAGAYVIKGLSDLDHGAAWGLFVL